jgi:CheY-like chemotaxis protein
LDLCRFLKKQQTTAHIAEIMVSANPGIGALAKNAGADDYIEKSFELAGFLKMVHGYLHE